jgi:hypothetical protein
MPKSFMDEVEAWEIEEAARRAADFDRTLPAFRKKAEAERIKDAAMEAEQSDDEQDDDDETED